MLSNYKKYYGLYIAKEGAVSIFSADLKMEWSLFI